MSWNPILDPHVPLGAEIDSIDTVIVPRARDLGGFEVRRALPSPRRVCGWGWLAVDSNGSLKVLSTPNQDSPISQGLTPILGVDVWEHAYYLNYQNERGSYLNAWWNVVNWSEVSHLYKQAAG